MLELSLKLPSHIYVVLEYQEIFVHQRSTVSGLCPKI